MNQNENKVRGLGLCSGGLDSILSAVILRNQGLEVEWITFETPFFSSEKAREASLQVNIPLTVRHITDIYLKMLKNPHCGYGQHMNPCLDCHSLMFELAGEFMVENGFDFLFSGEVLGQRPMSQTRSSLRYVEKHSGMAGYIIRPLSAKLLSESIPEQKGWVDRNLLLELSGRSRKPQMRLAEAFGITRYPNPAGGCLLTDVGYSARLKDLFRYQDSYRETEFHLLKYGRHLRLDDGSKLIIGRTQNENDRLLEYLDSGKDTVVKTHYYPGPTAVMPGFNGNRESLLKAAAICAGYSKAPSGNPVSVHIQEPSGEYMLQVVPMAPQEIRELII
jgi:tRNA U34 2-thiouridine synthase MnmA/TrmU